MVHDILHKRAKGKLMLVSEPDLKLGELDAVHKSYKAAMQGIVDIRNTLSFACLEHVKLLAACFSTNYAGEDYYLFMARKLRRLATHAIAMEEQVSTEPIPPPPTQERARLYCDLGEEVYSTLMLVAKQFARVPENNQKKRSIRVGKSNQDSQSNDRTGRGMTKSPKSSLIRCCAPCAHEHNTQNFRLRQKVQNIRCIISKLSNTQSLTRQGTHTYGAPLKCNSMPQIHERRSHISQSPGLSPLEFAPLRYAKEYTVCDTTAWAQPGPVLLNACQEQADDVYNGMVINMGVIVLKVVKYAAQLDHADQKGMCTLEHYAYNAAHDTFGVTI